MATMASGTPLDPTVAAGLRQQDLMKSVEGMFNGVLVNIARVLQEPKHAETTKLIIAECTKKYQDVLDDCEIQILDAKWYLESKLAENKAWREAEAKAKETTTANTSAKRKHDEVEQEPGQLQPETPAKRAKSNDPSPIARTAATALSSPGAQSAAVEKEQVPSKFDTENIEQSLEQPPTQEKTNADPEPEAVPESKPASGDDTVQEPQADVDEFVKTSAQATPDMMGEEYDNFQSMFGEPTEPNEEAANNNNNNTNNDVNMEFNIDDFIGDSNEPMPADSSTSTTQNQPQSQAMKKSLSQSQQPSLQSLPQSQPQPQQQAQTNANFLCGLEQYANAQDPPSDNANMFTDTFEPNIFDSLLEDGNFDVNDTSNFGNIGDDVGNIENPNDRDYNFEDYFGNE